MKTLEGKLRHTILVVCCLLGALLSAGEQGYAGSQGYLSWISSTDGDGFTESGTSSVHVPVVRELPAPLNSPRADYATAPPPPNPDRG